MQLYNVHNLKLKTSQEGRLQYWEPDNHWPSYYFFQGDYKIVAKLTNKDTGEQLGCYHVEITFSRPCSGLACIFG